MDKGNSKASQWHVRKAKPDELQMIAELEKVSFHNPWSLLEIESFYYKSTSDIFVWREKNRISGYVMAERVLEQGEVHRIAVVPGVRGNGIGMLLYKGFLERYREMGVETIFLEVRESNKTAINFYLKCGYEEYGRRSKYYRDPMEDAILMYWDDPEPIQSLPLEDIEDPSYNESCEEEAVMICNVCGNEISKEEDCISVKKEWGYFSKKDLEIHEFKICERCYDRLIKQFEVAPTITEKKEILS